MKHKKIPSLLAGVLLCYSLSFSATIYKRCTATEVLSRQLKKDPSMKLRMSEIEQFTNKYIQSAAGQRLGSSSQAAPVTIPVVVHILYNTPSQNISDAMVQAQLDVLNKDYSAENIDKGNLPESFSSALGNTGIQFCLAKKDPSGNTTSGIIRKSTSVIAFADDDKMKFAASGGDNAWDASQYLNIWICNMSNGILGYAQFPGGPANTDGLVLLYSTLPGGTSVPYNQGRTATHEVGHWLNLKHLWGDADCGDDLVSDTPAQQTANFGCPSFPHMTCNNSGDMSMNFMDYSDDACMYMFTNGQTARLKALFAAGGARASFLTSNACTPAADINCGSPTALNSASVSATSAALSWAGVSNATEYTIQYKAASSSTWVTLSSTSTSRTITGLQPNTTYTFKVRAICSAIGAYTAPASFTTLPADCGIPSGLNATSVNVAGATLSWNAVSGAASYNIMYKAENTGVWMTASSATNSKVLTGLVQGTEYTFKIQAVCTSLSSFSPASSFITSFTVEQTLGCSDGYEANNTFQTSANLPVNKEIKEQISSSSDVDWYKFTNTASSQNIKITLSNLPKDYDVELYNASGIFLIMSDNTGNTSETIVYNGAPAGTYYVKVFGYGNVSAPSCYTLKAQTSATMIREVEVTNSKSARKDDGKVSIFPNPTSGDFTIRYFSDMEAKVNFTIYDLSGKPVKADAFESVKGESQKAISMPDVVNGLYLIDLNNGKERKMYKVVINK